jgi:NADPH:quinone reductase-like Zn-dependent oxidoreductase
MEEQSASRPLTGKAVAYKHRGAYEVIEIVERTVRAPGAGEVGIEVKAAAVNPTDILLRDPGFGFWEKSRSLPPPTTGLPFPTRKTSAIALR